MKNFIDDLAIFGGPPLFNTIRPRAQLSAGPTSTFYKHAKQIYTERRLTNFGPLVRSLEQRLAEFHDVDYCISYCNACVALIALFALAKEKTGKSNIIMPAFTYDGLPHLAQWAGLRPVFCDIDEKTHTLAPEAVSDAIDESVAAIVGVHQVNNTCHIKQLEQIAREADVPLFFDSVYGFNCMYEGRQTGPFGNAEAFSLHATKLINGFEGGYITTNDPELATKLKKIRTFGFSGKDRVVQLGLNGKLNEIHAAMALASMDSMEETICANHQRYSWYRNYFQDIKGCKILPYEEGRSYNYCFVLLELCENWNLNRDQIVSILKREQAYAAPYYSPPLHRSEHMPKDQERPHLPITDRVSQKFISMPVGEFVDRDTIERLAHLFGFISQNDGAILKRFTNEH